MIAGALFLAGGGETPAEVVDAFLDRVGRGSLIVVLGQVREEPANAESSREMLIEHGARMVVLLPFGVFNKKEREVTEVLAGAASGIWVPGGDQGALMDRLGDDFARRVIGGAVRRGASYFGTSAGAMLASETMIAGNGEVPGTTIYRKGLGLLDSLVDSHYRERNRQPRLAWTRERLQVRAIGLSEGEWVKIENGVIAQEHGKPYYHGW